MFDSMRDFIAYLEQNGQLARVPRPVNPYLEITRVAKAAIEQNGPALFFEKVDGYDIPIVTSLYSARERVFAALGTTAAGFAQHFHQKLKEVEAFPPRLIEAGPCQEKVLTGAAVDLSFIPITWHAEHDGGWYIPTGVCISKDPVSQVRNASFHRLKVHDNDHLALWMSPGDLRRIVDRYWERGEPCPVAVAIGVDPHIFIAACTSIPSDQDEFGLAGALKGKPVDMVPCKTVPLDVPATAEIILEGWSQPGVNKEEGPYGETSGYYSLPKVCPVINLTAITHREQPIYQDLVTGSPPDENQSILITHQAGAYEAATKMFPQYVLDLCLTMGGCTSFDLVVKINKQFPGQAKQIGAFLCTTLPRVKNIWVVNADIDPHNPVQVEWAFATRCRGERDILIMKGMKSVPLDPCAVNGMVDKIVFDCTLPLKEEMVAGERENVPVVHDTSEVNLLEYLTLR